MGTIEARIRVDRVYSKNHLYLLAHAGRPGEYRVGLTAFSIRLLRDIYFLDWSAGVDFPVKAKQEIGQIESSKAVSGLFAPGDGQILAFNDAGLSDPSLINASGYDDGWLFDFRTADEFLSPADYVKLLGETWDETQRAIKKQIVSG